MSFPHSDLPEGVRLVDDHGEPSIEVRTPAASAMIHLDGGHVTSFVPRGQQDLLWLSPDARFGPGRAIRGGIPLIGPWFGPGRDGGTTPAHGWLRTSRWSLEAAERMGDGVGIVLALNGADPAGTGVSARLFIGISERLRTELTVTAGAVGLELESALHTYLAVSDVREVTLHGLDGAAYLDSGNGLAPGMVHGDLRLEGPTDLICTSSDPVEVSDPAAGRTLVVEPEGASRIVVWNPWQAAGDALADVPGGGWRGFVCVEAAVAKEGFVELAPGQSHTLSASLRARPL